MIKTKTLNVELEKLEKDSKIDSRNGLYLIIKGICLLIKVVRDMKINQTIAMKAQFGENVFTNQDRKSDDGDKKFIKKYRGNGVDISEQTKGVSTK